MAKWISSSFLLTLLFLFVILRGYSVTLPSKDHPVQIYSTSLRDDLRLLFLKAIETAEKNIDVCMYSLTDPEIIDALKKKASTGVKVNIVYDVKASPNLQKQFSFKLLPQFGKALTHSKLLVVDNKMTLMGSTNWSTASLKYYSNIVVGMFDEQFSIFVKEKIDQLGNRSKPLDHHDFMIGEQPCQLWFLPDDPRASKKIVELIRSAKATLKVAMFTWTREDFAEEVIQANLRGVKVEVVIDRQSALGAGAKIVEKLKNAHLPVRLSTGQALFHYKLMVIDDEILVQGSANWTKSAFTKNDDCFMVLGGLKNREQNRLNQLWQVALYQSEEVRNE